jgi:cobaltochelatase CobT
MLDGNRKEALRLLATMLGRRFGVQVVFSKNIRTAATTGKVIYLPNLATTGTVEDMSLLYGLVAHEAAHCRFSEFKDNSEGNPLVRALDNIFEDIRIELALSRVFPGASRMLFDAAKGLADRGILEAPQEGREYQPADILCRALMNGLRSQHLDQDCLQAFAQEWRTLAADIFGDELIDEVFDLADRSTTINSSDEASALAWEVYELLETSAEEKEKEEQQKQQQQKQQQQQASNASQEEESPSIDSSSSADQDDDDTGETSPGPADPEDEDIGTDSPGSNDSNDDGDDEPAESRGSDGGDDDESSEDADESSRDEDASAGDPTDDLSDADDTSDVDAHQVEADSSDSDGDGDDDGEAGEQAAAMRQALNAQAVEPVSLEDMLRQEMGASHAMGSTARTRRANTTTGRKAQGEVHSYLKRHELKAKLGTRLASLIESTIEETLWDGYSGRKLCRTAPEKLARGDLKLFRKREETAGTNTAVALLVDYSGSMSTRLPLKNDASTSYPGEAIAQEAAYETHFALASVLTTYEVPFLSIAFAGNVCILKEFEEPLAAHRWNDTFSGATATGDAIEDALIRITEREEEKRILVVVTDGDPDDYESLMAGCRFARQNAIQIAFVFIGSTGFTLESMLTEEGVAFDRATSTDMLSRAVFGAVAKAVA